MYKIDEYRDIVLLSLPYTERLRIHVVNGFRTSVRTAVLRRLVCSHCRSLTLTCAPRSNLSNCRRVARVPVHLFPAAHAVHAHGPSDGDHHHSLRLPLR